MPKKREAPDPELEELGRRLRQARERRGLTQSAAEQHIGKSTNYISALENGRAGSPAVMVLRELAELYGVGTDALLGVGEGAAGTASVDGELLGRLMSALAKVYRDAGIKLSELELGRIAAEEYNVARGATQSEWPTVIRLASTRHAERIQREPLAMRRPGA